MGPRYWRETADERFGDPPPARCDQETFVVNSDGVKDMTHEAKAKAKDLTCHAALKPQTLYTVQC